MQDQPRLQARPKAPRTTSPIPEPEVPKTPFLLVAMVIASLGVGIIGAIISTHRSGRDGAREALALPPRRGAAAPVPPRRRPRARGYRTGGADREHDRASPLPVPRGHAREGIPVIDRSELETIVRVALRLGWSSNYLDLPPEDRDVFESWRTRSVVLGRRYDLKLERVRSHGSGYRFTVALDGETVAGVIVMKRRKGRWMVVGASRS